MSQPTPHTIRRHPGNAPTFTQSEVDEIVAKRLTRDRRAHADLVAAVLAGKHHAALQIAQEIRATR